MRGLMMDYQLTIPAILRRAGDALRTTSTVASRLGPTDSVVRHRYAEILTACGAWPWRCSELGVTPGRSRGDAGLGRVTSTSKRTWRFRRWAPCCTR